MKACIVKPHHAGLFSLINNVLTCLALYDLVQVDWSEGCLYGNAWPAIFDSHSIAPPADAEVKVIDGYPHQALTYRNAALLYQAANLLGWRESVNRHWYELRVKNEIYDRAWTFIEQLPESYTAVLVRSETHAGEQVYGRAQTRAQYCEALAPYRGEKIFVMSSDYESLEWFNEFDIATHPDTKRAARRDTQLHLEGGQTIADAIQCFIEVVILSQASALIHPVSNMATAALYMNPGVKSVFLA